MYFTVSSSEDFKVTTILLVCRKFKKFLVKFVSKDSYELIYQVAQTHLQTLTVTLISSQVQSTQVATVSVCQSPFCRDSSSVEGQLNNHRLLLERCRIILGRA